MSCCLVELWDGRLLGDMPRKFKLGCDAERSGNPQPLILGAYYLHISIGVALFVKSWDAVYA